MTAASSSFTAEAASVPTVRHFVRTTLDGLGLHAAWEAAAVLVSEAATNAVLHAKTEFTVEVVRDGDTVRVSVTDLSPAVPRQRNYGTDATTGRGLRLIATLAVAWGVDRTADGKTVWFEVLAVGDAATVVEPWEADADLDTILKGFDELDDSGSLHEPPVAGAARRTPRRTLVTSTLTAAA